MVKVTKMSDATKKDRLRQEQNPKNLYYNNILLYACKTSAPIVLSWYCPREEYILETGLILEYPTYSRVLVLPRCED